MPNKKKNIILNDCLAANRLVGTRFLISGGRIGNGNFGEVRLGIDVKTKEKYEDMRRDIFHPTDVQGGDQDGEKVYQRRTITEEGVENIASSGECQGVPLRV